MESLDNLFSGQLACWEQAGDNYKALDKVLTRELVVDGFPFRVQFNPARIISSSAKIDDVSIRERKCFLCAANRPSVQRGLSFSDNSCTSERYTVLINPFPIFPKHLTIPLDEHKEQLINDRFCVMLSLARTLKEYTIFYNGPKCGASAPDHFHFQAGNKGFLPLERVYDRLRRKIILKRDNTILWEVQSGINGVIVIESSLVQEMASLFGAICSQLAMNEGEKEPMINLLCWYESPKWVTHIFIRKKHRPSCYFASGESNILISPAAVDLGGTFITPLEKDFRKITEEDIRGILGEICISFSELSDLSAKLRSLHELT
jgi:hypothetical protein